MCHLDKLLGVNLDVLEILPLVARVTLMGVRHKEESISMWHGCAAWVKSRPVLLNYREKEALQVPYCSKAHYYCQAHWF